MEGVDLGEGGDVHWEATVGKNNPKHLLSFFLCVCFRVLGFSNRLFFQHKRRVKCKGDGRSLPYTLEFVFLFRFFGRQSPTCTLQGGE